VRLAGAIDDPHAAAAQVDALDDPERAVQLAALESLGRHHRVSVPGAVERVSALLAEHPVWSVRTLAAATLGRLASEGSRVALERALATDEYAFVREAAARALGQTADPRAVTALRVAARRDPESAVRAAAERARRMLEGETTPTPPRDP
jgi:HEAT repeat protein